MATGPRTGAAAILAVALGLVGCTAAEQSAQVNPDATVAQDGGATAIQLPGIAASERQNVPSALDDPNHDAFPEPLVPPEELRSGGPPPDGIPALDEPRFVRAADVDYLEDDESVLSFSHNGETRAYPIQIMVWHEIVNDTVADTPVAVTYCPLCNSAVVLDRRVNDLVLSFGTSGMLHKSDLVMYDRQTESLWPQLGFQAAIGHLTGARPTILPVSTVTWGEFKAQHPDSWVLSRDTGYSRAYGSNPYVGYDGEQPERPFLFDGELDGRLPAKTHIVGLYPQDDPVAVTIAHLLEHGPTLVQGPDGDVVLWARPDVRTPLDADTVDAGRQTGAAVAFESTTNKGARVTLVTAEQGRGAPLFDTSSGSGFRWDGTAVTGPLKGERLKQVATTDTFWFAWAAFRPETQLIK